MYRQLTADLAAPSLWDDVIAALARDGYPVPAGPDRDEPDPAVEAAWVDIYRHARPDYPWWLLGEALTVVAERFQLWRERHLTAVARTIGDKSGSGGSAGIAWLRTRRDRVVFPELWSARTSM